MKLGTRAAREAADRTATALAFAQQINTAGRNDSIEVQLLLTEITRQLSIIYPNVGRQEPAAQRRGIGLRKPSSSAQAIH